MFRNWLSMLGLAVIGAWLAMVEPLHAQVDAVARSSQAARLLELSAAMRTSADVSVATERRGLLLAMMRQAPSVVLEAALPQDVRERLPLDVQALVETQVDVEGEAEVRYEDGEYSSRLRRLLHADQDELELHFAGEPAGFVSGHRVRIRGVRLGSDVAADGGSATVTQVVSALPATFGEQRVLMILVNFQDKPTLQPYSATTASNQIFGTVSSFDRENSQEQTWLAGDVTGWFTIPVSSTICDTTGIRTFAQQAAQAAGFNLASYTRFVYAFPSNANCSWSGSGQVGGSVTHAWINGSLTTRVLAHELGHNFGVYHSRALECGSTTLGTNCTAVEYGDPFDVMGVSAVVAHFNAFQKERLGWLNYGSSLPILSVQGDGTFTIEPYASAGTGAKALKILKSVDPTTGQRTYYYVEYRMGTGFDGSLAGNATLANGVVVHTGSESTGNSSYVLDMTPETASWADAALAVGRSFSDPEAGVTITPVSAGSAGATVEVQLDSLACVPAAPRVAISTGATQATVAGAPTTYAMTIANPSSAGCAPSAIVVAAAVPPDWIAIAPSAMTISPGAAAPATLTVTAPSGTGGSYTIVVSATDGTTGLSGSAAVSLTVVSALDVAASASVTGGKGNRSIAIRTLVQGGAAPVSGAAVSVTVQSPSGTSVSSNAATAADGTATVTVPLKTKDPSGTYQVRVIASKGIVSGSTSTTATVR